MEIRILSESVSECHNDLHNLKNKILQTVTDFIQTYGEDDELGKSLEINRSGRTFVNSDDTIVGGSLHLMDNGRIFIDQFDECGDILENQAYVFNFLDLDCQIMILDSLYSCIR